MAASRAGCSVAIAVGSGADLAMAGCRSLPVHAQAPEQPLLAPTRDVTVTYRLSGGGIDPVAEKMSITCTRQGERVRLDYVHWAESKTPILPS